MAKKIRPAIVTIYTTTNVKVPDNPWERFFRGFQDDERSEGREREIPQPGLGSGIIVSEDGYILTNHHVIKDVDELRVQLVDMQEFEAEVIGTDPETEVALIKIDAKGLTVNPDHVGVKWSADFYYIGLKDGSCGMRYGRNYYDFEEGVLAFTAPGQVKTITAVNDFNPQEGWMLYFHPDLIRSTPLGENIDQYSFFSANSIINSFENSDRTRIASIKVKLR